MSDKPHRNSEILSLIAPNAVRHNLGPATLIEHAIKNNEAQLSLNGSLVADTGKFTGRSPKDRFVVKDALTQDLLDWGPVNQPVEPEKFETLYQDMCDYASNQDLYIQDLYVGRDELSHKPVRVITQLAWHNLFAQNLFVREPWENVDEFWTVLDLPGFVADPVKHGCRTDTMIAMDFSRHLVLVANTAYAGEIKKSLFAVMNFELPASNQLPMHCSANYDEKNKSALFFGLSGTGKTTLSADLDHTLVGDDEHGWNEHGVFNFEGGCYAKTNNLAKESEPVIYDASVRFGSILENVVLDENQNPIFADVSKTENTRSAYPLTFVKNASIEGKTTAPQDIFFLTADAYGILPPLSRLTTDAAMYHFLSGYTSKLAGTERGVTEPEATFSACFGSPFLPLAPVRYAELFKQKLATNNVRVWLINTGWQGGMYGVGKRIKLAYSRAMVLEARSGRLDNARLQKHSVFNLDMIVECPGVPKELLNPEVSWQDTAEYQKLARKLANQFISNFEKFHNQVSPEVIAAGPKS